MFCVKCGTPAPGGSSFCRSCGAALPAASQTRPAAENVPAAAPAVARPAPSPIAVAAPQSAPRYAGFWRRFLAAVIDAVIVLPLWLVLSALYSLAESTFLQRAVFSPDGVGLSRALWLFSAGRWVLLAVIVFAYYALMEATPRGASLGKRVVGLRVTGLDGKRAGIFRSTARTALKLLSAALFMIGYLMAGVTRRKQALHDEMSSTLVVRR